VALHRQGKKCEFSATVQRLLDGGGDIFCATTAQKRKSVPFLDENFRPVLSAIGPAIRHTPTDRKLDPAALATLARKDIPDGYGLPDRQQMRARIARLTWILGYLQNGAVSHYYASRCADVAADTSASYYGWRARPLPATTENINCSYYTQTYASVILGNMPVVVTCTEETDNVVI